MEALDSMMGPIRRSDKSRGWRLPRAILNRWLNCLARYVPMPPSWRAGIHRLRGVKVGKRVFIGAEVFIDDAEPDLVVLEDDVTIIARCAILAHGYYPRHLEKYLQDAGERKGVTIKQGAYIGFGALLLPGVTIGEEAIVGAGAVVPEDVPARSVVLGQKARLARTLEASPEAPPAGDTDPGI